MEGETLNHCMYQMTINGLGKIKHAKGESIIGWAALFRALILKVFDKLHVSRDPNEVK